MKKFFIFLIILFIFASIFIEASPNNQGQQKQNDPDFNSTSKNITNASNKDITAINNLNQGNGQKQTPNQVNASNIKTEQLIQITQQEGNISAKNQNQIMSNNEQQVRSIVQQKTKEMNPTGSGIQNQVRAEIAVETMESAAIMFSSQQGEVFNISNEIKKSLEITTRTEEKIRNRSGLVRFLVGGDVESANTISQEVIRNQERLRELNRIVLESDFDAQTKAILQEQIKNIEQEQLRLKNLSEQEINNRGILGWLIK